MGTVARRSCGLHLDPRPGIHVDVFELDFASLFPSLIATRNISPETLGCTCCAGSGQASFVPLDPDEAKRWFRKRDVSQRLNRSGSSSAALNVPGLELHTCLQHHGLLGRVVAPHPPSFRTQSPTDRPATMQTGVNWP